MNTATCKGCGKAFDYDEVSGLNMKRFDPESNARYIFIGGVCPACPDCGARFQPPPVYTEIKYEKRYVSLKLPRRLPE